MDYQVMPPLTTEEYAELKNDIAKRGVMVPIEFDEAGNVLDGHHRLQICRELGITEYPKVIRAGMTEAEKRTHARKLNMARRQLSREQRQRVIDDALRENPEKSDRQIGRELGVDNKTVASRRGLLEAGEEIPHLETTTGVDGKQYPRQVERKPVFVPDEDPGAYLEPDDDDVKQALYELDELMIEHPVLNELVAERPLLDELIVSHDGESSFYEHAKSAVEEQRQEKQRPHVAFNSGNNEWYTPAEYIEAARRAMGSIDFDPASSEIANRVVKAEEYYTAETNGLAQTWRGNVWMNPPYASDLIGKFIDKLISERGNYKQAIVLVNNATETEWFGKLVSVSSAVCFPHSRVKFYMPDGKTGAPLQGQAVLYIGENTDSFLKEYSVLGWEAMLYGLQGQRTRENSDSEQSAANY